MATALKQAGNVAFAQGDWCSRPSDQEMMSWQNSYFTVQSCAGNFTEALQVYLDIKRRIKQKQLSYTVTYQQLSLS